MLLAALDIKNYFKLSSSLFLCSVLKDTDGISLSIHGEADTSIPSLSLKLDFTVAQFTWVTETKTRSEDKVMQL